MILNHNQYCKVKLSIHIIIKPKLLILATKIISNKWFVKFIFQIEILL